MSGHTSYVYMDHNASSPARPEVIAAMNAALLTPGNGSAPHAAGRAARKLVEEARENVALAMGVCAQDLIFTGSGTESINTAIHSAINAGCKRLLISSMDHPASILMAETYGVHIDLIPALPSGALDVHWLALALKNWQAKDGRPFIAVAAVNSETGVIQDMDTIADLVRGAQGLLLVDAVQALGKINMRFQPDYLAVSAHKIGGPQGVGALYIAPGAPYSSLLIGGGQEKNRRAGSLNVAGIAGFGAAAKVVENVDHTHNMRDAIEAGLKKIEPEIVFFGTEAPRLVNTSFFAIPDTPATTLMMALDLAGVCVSTGLACSSGKVGESRAVRAMGVSELAPHGAIRISLGYTNTAKDVPIFLDAWKTIRKHSIRGAA